MIFKIILFISIFLIIKKEKEDLKETADKK